MTGNLNNAVFALFVRAVILGLVAWTVKDVYAPSIFYADNIQGTQQYLLYGANLTLLLWLYLELMISFYQVIFNERLGHVKPRPRGFMAQFALAKIQVAQNEAQLKEQLARLPKNLKGPGIIGVACRLADARIIWSPNLARHPQLLWYAKRVLHTGAAPECEQGFITAQGQYLDRKHAAPVALAAGQVKDNVLDAPPWLLSEDIH